MRSSKKSSKRSEKSCRQKILRGARCWFSLFNRKEGFAHLLVNGLTQTRALASSPETKGQGIESAAMARTGAIN